MAANNPFPGFNENVKVGEEFSNRESVRMAGLHNQVQAGISINVDKSAFSVIVRDKGGYIDDEDYGSEILYTGQGGRDKGKHIANQELVLGNRALVVSYELQKPIHVVRGFVAKGSTPAFYRYDGLFNVEEYWTEKGQEGYKVYRFRLIEINSILEKSVEKNVIKKSSQVTAEGNANPGRKLITSSSIIRDQKLAKQVKELYEYKCQICNIQIKVPTGFYAESAHIKPLGNPHNGPDTIRNIICLCPNHHVMFDKYSFSIDDNFDLIGIEGSLNVHKDHNINKEFLKYHREISNRTA